MRFLRWALALVVLLAPAAFRPGTVTATSYAPVSFQELVNKADVIFIGDVLNVQPFTVSTARGTVIKTRVTFLVRDALWGTTASMESFEFLGGKSGGFGMQVAEMPTFSPGDRRVVFARRETSINPIVGFTQGLMHVSRDAALGVDAVQTNDGRPLANTQDIGRPGGSVRRERGMPLSALRAQIVGALRERRR